jgi:hypothetical protein
MSMDLRPRYMENFSIPKPSLLHNKPGSTMMGDQKGKLKVISEGPRCYKCKGFRHNVIVSFTIDKKLTFIYEKELIKIKKVEEEENEGCIDYDDEHLSASKLPSFVIYVVLTRTRKEFKANPEWLCTNIFHTCIEPGG